MSGDAIESLPAVGRLVGIDLGEVRIGIAVSDPGQVVASPAETLHVPRGRDDVVLDSLVEVLERHEAVGIVVGNPRRLDGREGAAAARARRVAAALTERTGLASALVDERFSTVEAERILIDDDMSRRARKDTVDRVAAGVLLQGVLERRRARRSA